MRTVQAAAILALVGFLQTQMDASLGHGKVNVIDEFPVPDVPLHPMTISVVPVGAREDIHVQEQVVDYQSVDATTGQYKWRVKACRQQLQLDVWCETATELDEVLAVLDVALHLGPNVTLQDPVGDVTRDGPLLRLNPAHGHGGFVDFTFEGPEPLLGGTDIQERQCRALVRGYADVDLVVTTRVPKLKRVLLKLAMDGAATPTTYTYQPKNGEFELSGSTEV